MTIVWDTFERAARMAARVQRIPDAMMAITPHRKGNEGGQEQRAKARDLVPEIVRKLLAT